jgi:hypothetical protein
MSPAVMPSNSQAEGALNAACSRDRAKGGHHSPDSAGAYEFTCAGTGVAKAHD